MDERKLMLLIIGMLRLAGIVGFIILVLHGFILWAVVLLVVSLLNSYSVHE